jgi:hypothetical protein
MPNLEKVSLVRMKILNSWANDKLHKSFKQLTKKEKRFFEIQFEKEQGKTSTSSHLGHKYENQPIAFFSWKPHLFSFNSKENENLDHPIWI